VEKNAAKGRGRRQSGKKRREKKEGRREKKILKIHVIIHVIYHVDKSTVKRDFGLGWYIKLSLRISMCVLQVHGSK
jgi:hypothetical protein